MIGNSHKVWLLLAGIFSMTQVNIIGWIGITEFVFFIAAPFLFIRNYSILRRHGFTPVLWLAILMLLGGFFANWWNHIPFRDAARGTATCYGVFVLIVSLHHLLHKDIDDVKWLFLGMAISGVICTFVFVPGADRTVQGGEVLFGSEATAHRVGYSLFWLTQFTTWVCLPIQTLYLSCTSLYVKGTLFCLIFISLFSAGSRSGFAIVVISLSLMLIGGKKVARMAGIRRNFFVLFFLGAIAINGVGAAYKALANSGYLGEQQYNKYIAQTSRGTGLLSILMSGRSGFFSAFYAALDKPIIGHGSWALDRNGYYRHFLEEYGSNEELEEYYASSVGRGEMDDLLPGHSQIMVGWTWYGIFGLIFWLYVLWLYLTTLSKQCPSYHSGSGIFVWPCHLQCGAFSFLRYHVFRRVFCLFSAYLPKLFLSAGWLFLRR